ncbi:Hypothetical Protein FCC1311_013082 [Hondaea fermentalgiana]|uniref:Uncharacterized protein n=1 Tax=Hondaea fermentalgiana TaxID=2315210 RepID=A0A2R5GAI4_9STRA|nr:Hypothetical Protein FCC1311_013082 [Hondaea fermentalgiana]|eukprot:GBG25091.1 Hypothetical Protein FCC1311_013082 [Hondaea fermentalgiana]
MSQNAGRVVALGVGACCVAVVGVVGVYLPFHSDFAIQGAESRRELHKLNLPQGADVSGQKAGLAPSSMWKNLDTQQKLQQEAATNPESSQ